MSLRVCVFVTFFFLTEINKFQLVLTTILNHKTLVHSIIQSIDERRFPPFITIIDTIKSWKNGKERYVLCAWPNMAGVRDDCFLSHLLLRLLCRLFINNATINQNQQPSYQRNNDNNNDQGVFVNWWETDVYFIQIPWNLKVVWQERLLTLVQDWAGVPIEQTVMYGLRQYESGARLLTHVDRVTTHAVSLIVNVAQIATSAANATHWPVEVHDHAGRLHEVNMEPGDVVYYESAKNLHSRNRPLAEGASYINLFTHYRPIGDDEWYTRENPPGTPEPILEDDIEGSCHVPALPAGQSELYNIGKVVCDDKRLGPWISPTLWQAKGADDLIAWWERTSPAEATPGDGNCNCGALQDRIRELERQLEMEARLLAAASKEARGEVVTAAASNAESTGHTEL